MHRRTHRYTYACFACMLEYTRDKHELAYMPTYKQVTNAQTHTYTHTTEREMHPF